MPREWAFIAKSGWRYQGDGVAIGAKEQGTLPVRVQQQNTDTRIEIEVWKVLENVGFWNVGEGSVWIGKC